MKAFALAAMAVVLFVLHQDFWNWKNTTLIFGYIPVGLFYHGCYSALCAVMMVFFVKYAWPHELEEASEKHGN
ncbi:MAG TPA: hypothetical protein VEK08_06490 [Planctomycetota bacterium]|nr:hypothetical protein [Planctomycetota bacterium]